MKVCLTFGFLGILRQSIPSLHSHPADPVAAYTELMAASPTTSPNQPILTMPGRHTYWVVTVSMLSADLNILLDALSLDASLYSLHSLRRGDATTAYSAGAQQMDIKRHGLWASDTFWLYVTYPCAQLSPVAGVLAASVSAAQ